MSRQILILFTVIALILASCARAPRVPSKEELINNRLQIAQQYLNNRQYLDAAFEYSQIANEVAPPRRQDMQLRAAEALIQGSFLPQAKQILKQIDLSKVDTIYQVRKDILDARVAIQLRDVKLTESILKRYNATNTLPDQLAQIYEIQAQALSIRGKQLTAADKLIQREALLRDPADIEQNQIQLLETLGMLTNKQIVSYRDKTANPTLKGWLDISLLQKQFKNQPSRMKKELKTWRSHNPTHPLHELTIATLIQPIDASRIGYPTHIAVLLPLSGKLQKPASAIRDGVMSAYYRSTQDPKPELRFYDTGDDEKDVQNIYDQAVDDGADFIIGPLNKSSVTQLADKSSLDRPTLALNYSDSTEKETKNLYQISLLPEDEARQMAERARLDGHEYALVFYPEGPFGERLYTAFKQRWEEIGGKLVEAQAYDSKLNDFSGPIKRALNIDESQSRHRIVNSVIRANTTFTPRRRQDVDFIFLAAFPRQARQIGPQLKFHHAIDLPVYSTSHAYEGKLNPRMDRDINEVVFVDMPWVLGRASKGSLKASVNQLWPDEQDRYTRLFALGIDAFEVIPHLQRLKDNPFSAFDGQTGNIQMGLMNRLNRRLSWAQFRNGVPVLIE